MPKYRVEVHETVVTYRQKYYTADTEEAAKDMAEAEDWREWEVLEVAADSRIDFIEEMED